MISGVFFVWFNEYKEVFRREEIVRNEGQFSVIFFGDMMFDREMRRLGEKDGYGKIFDCMRDVLLARDAVVANLEGPITNNKSESLGSKPGSADNYKFTFDPVITDSLLLANIGYVNIGNNHILNFGKDGLVQTRQALTKAGISYFGSPQLEGSSELASSSIAYIEGGAKKIALINYNQFWQDNVGDVAKLVEIKKGEGNIAIVYAHWGEEYASTTDSQRSVAHAFIDSGADVVMGSHPHVIQEIEEYKGRPIFYSLGNFVFDQWWNDAVRDGLGVRMMLNGTSTELHFDTISTRLGKDGVPCPVTATTT